VNPTRNTFLALGAAAFAILVCACGDEVEPEKKKPENTAEAPSDSLDRVGDEAARTIGTWVSVLASVQTESSAAAAKQQLASIAEQFDALAERAAVLPKISRGDYQRIDKRMDSLVLSASNGLEHHRARIFSMPAEIREQVLPANDDVLESFRAMGRTISANTVEGNPDKETKSKGAEKDKEGEDEKETPG